MLFMLSHKQMNFLTEDVVLLIATNCKLIVDLEKNNHFLVYSHVQRLAIAPSSTAAADAKRSWHLGALISRNTPRESQPKR